MISTVRRVRLVYYLAHDLTEVKLEGVPVDYGVGQDCVLVINFKCWDLPVN